MSKNMVSSPFWEPQDEAEYIRQEQQRVKAMKEAAFTAGFDAGAAWGLSRGVQELARIFEKTAGGHDEFPPDLVKSFAASMIEFAPIMEKTIITELKKARGELTPAKLVKKRGGANPPFPVSYSSTKLQTLSKLYPMKSQLITFFILKLS